MKKVESADTSLMWLARERKESEMMPGFGALGITILVLPWKGKKSGILEKEEFSFTFIEVNELAKNELKCSICRKIIGNKLGLEHRVRDRFSKLLWRTYYMPATVCGTGLQI